MLMSGPLKTRNMDNSALHRKFGLIEPKEASPDLVSREGRDSPSVVCSCTSLLATCPEEHHMRRENPKMRFKCYHDIYRPADENRKSVGVACFREEKLLTRESALVCSVEAF